MTTTSSRSLLAAAASPLAIAAALLIASPAFAQDTPPQPPAEAPAEETEPTEDGAAPPAPDEPDEQTIVVTGFRAALQNAVNTKKRQDLVVESVSAEDIGKLPDNGIGESIARLPGLAAQRSQGRANIISIRGFGPDFSTTTLNGREQTTTNDSRAVEFDQFPSEILNQVVVYKTPSADLTAGGLVGSIDLRTIRPLAAGRQIIAFGARGTYADNKLQPDSSDNGRRFYGTFVDQFADDMVGVALSASYTDEPYHTRDWNAWGYDSYNSNSQLMTGVKTWVESSKLKRLGLNGTLQTRVSEQLTLTADAFYSNFKDKVDQRGFEFPDFPAWGFSTLTNVQEDDGMVTGGTFSNIFGIVENYANDRKADLYSLGFNAAFDNGIGWTGLVDVSWSRTDRKDRFLQTTAGTGRSRSGASDTIGFDWSDEGPEFDTGLNYADPALIMLTDTQGWGWFNGPINQAGYDNKRSTEDDLRQFRAEIGHELGGFIDKVKLGVNYTDRSKSLTANENYLIPAGGVDAIAVPSNLLLDPVTLDRGFGPILTYDPRTLVDAGILEEVENNFGEGKGYNVREKLLTPYLMATIRSNVGIADLTGNVGIQAVHTRQNSTGLTYPNGVATRVTLGTKYWEYLPSLNLALRFPSDFVVRAAASRQIMRPRMPQLTTNIGYGVDTTLGIISGGGGNPYLKPFKTTGLDFNVEKYFGTKGYVALQTFYKNIDRYIASGVIEDFDYSDFPPPPNAPVSPIGRLFTDVNTKGGHMYGAELAGTVPFEVLVPSLSGFGVTGGLGYTKTKVKDFNGNTAEIPGYSKWVGSVTGFYENYGFNARASMRYRSKYIGDFALYSGGLDRQHVLAETIYDAQVGYDFQSGSPFGGLSLYLQALNLTDERAATVAPTLGDLGYLKYQTYGRRYLAGLTYKFR